MSVFPGVISAVVQVCRGLIQEEVVSLSIMGWDVVFSQIVRSHAISIVISWIIVSCTIVVWGAVISNVAAGGGSHPRSGWLSQVAHLGGELRGQGV